MKCHTKILMGILGLGLAVASLATAHPTLALTFSQDIGVSFTFNSTLRLTLSSADIIIPNLAPGTAADSNIIDINIATNAVNGYTLSATVGNDTTYNTRDLIHQNSSVPDKFASVDFGSSITTNTDLADNTWAYSHSEDNGTTWSDYNGLPLFNDATNVALLRETNNPVSSATGDITKFKIAARASSSQTSGEYNNVINFTATAKVVPTTLSESYANAGMEKLNGYYKLQDMTPTICANTEIIGEGSQMQAIDTRDNKVYYITKLADGKCWMTQNLDHDIDKNRTYTPQDTDIPANWTPDKSTYQTGDTTWDRNWNGTGRFIQQSYDPGTKYWNEMFYSDVAYDEDACLEYGGSWDNSGDDENPWYECYDPELSSPTGNPHYHLGNYYNWGAAVAMNDTSAYTTHGQDVDQSICPAGWTLPKGGNNTSAGSFRYLVEQYGWESYYMNNPYIWGSPLYFPLSGHWFGYLGNVGSIGFWWSPVAYSDQYAYNMLAYYDGAVYPVGYGDNRDWGRSVRCISR